MGTEGRVALGALPLAGLIAAPHTLEAEDVEALGKDRVLLAGVTAGAGQPRLVLFDLLLEDFIGVRVHLHLPLLLQLAPQP